MTFTAVASFIYQFKMRLGAQFKNQKSKLLILTAYAVRLCISAHRLAE